MITTFARELARHLGVIVAIVIAVALLEWLLPEWAEWPFLAVLVLGSTMLSTRTRRARQARQSAAPAEEESRPEVPYPMMDEDGEHFWLPVHVEPVRMVLAAVVEQMIEVGADEAMHILVGGPTRRDLTVVSDRPVWAWSYDDQRRRARDLVESVEHVWMVEHPDDEERMVHCRPEHPGAQPFTHLPVTGALTIGERIRATHAEHVARYDR